MFRAWFMVCLLYCLAAVDASIILESASGYIAKQSQFAFIDQAYAQPVPTADATIPALEQRKIILEIEKLENENNWLWGNSIALLTALGAIGIGGFGVWRFFLERKAEREKRQEERERHTDENFHKISQGLIGDHMTVLASAQALHTFLGENYKSYYTKVFGLAFFQLRSLRYDPNDRNLKLRQAALASLFREAAKVRNTFEQPYIRREIILPNGDKQIHLKRNFDAVGSNFRSLIYRMSYLTT